MSRELWPGIFIVVMVLALIVLAIGLYLLTRSFP
jgi:hypothetical protein